ncbi:MAG TPA: S-layer homology domain-containing protein [Pseudobacteroides sp.]|nr:S-layer homology domain-containing protein [Pseudobacteroides sp.]
MKWQRNLVLFMIFMFIFIINSIFSVTLAENELTIKFSDVKSTDWYYEYVQKISSMGLVKGVGKDSQNMDIFAPDKKLIIAEMLTVVLRALNENTEKLPSDTTWYDCVIRKSKELGLVLEGEFTKKERLQEPRCQQLLLE